MAQPYLGDREQIPARYPRELNMNEIAREAGYRYTGRYLADLACLHHGHPEMMFGPDMIAEQEQLSA